MKYIFVLFLFPKVQRAVGFLRQVIFQLEDKEIENHFQIIVKDLGKKTILLFYDDNVL